ncbi:hypothetical protein OF83DRAFT_1086146 [Amylostereum chailletii]|nr:hypothetical protein OF83DRAFT_1086146 [Amylostereum chailletii]
MTPQQKSALTRKLRAQEKADKARLAEEAKKLASQPPTALRASETTALQKKVWQNVSDKKPTQNRECAQSTTAPPDKAPKKTEGSGKHCRACRNPVLTSVVVPLIDGSPDDGLLEDESPQDEMSSSFDQVQDGTFDSADLQVDIPARDCAMAADEASEFVASSSGESEDSDGSLEADEFIGDIQQPEVQASHKSKAVAKKLAQGILRFADEPDDSDDGVFPDELHRHRCTLRPDLTADDSDNCDNSDSDDTPASRTQAHSKPVPAQSIKLPAQQAGHHLATKEPTVPSKTPTKEKSRTSHKTAAASQLLPQCKKATVVPQQDRDGNHDIHEEHDDETSPGSIGLVFACDATVKPKDTKQTANTLVASLPIKSEAEDDVKPVMTRADLAYTDYILNKKGSINITKQTPKLCLVLNHAICVNVLQLLFFKNAFPGADNHYLLIDALVASADEHNLGELSEHLKTDPVYTLKLSEVPRDCISNIHGEIYHNDVCGFVFRTYGLDQFKTPRAIAVATSSLIKDNAYIFLGKFMARHSFTNGQWKPNQTLPYYNDALTELANKLWFCDAPCHHFSSELYGNDDRTVEYRLPRAMVAFLAAAIHAALHEWLEGVQTSLPNGFNANTYSKIYHDHLATLDSLGQNVEEMILASLYDAASGSASTWTEEEKPVVGTPNPLISAKDVEHALLSRRR